jgi:vitamin B12 transporter
VTAGSLFSRDRDDNTVTPAYYRSRLWKTESNVSRRFGAHTPTLGAEYYEEAGRSSEIQGRREFRAGAAFLHDRFARGPWEATVGGRLDFHSEHPKAFTFGSGASYWLVPGSLQARAHLGSGFKAPTLYQTYSPYGSSALSASRSLGGDAGFLWRNERWEAELGYYANRFRSLIDFDVTKNRYFNIGRAYSHGIEASLSRAFGDYRLRDTFTTTRAVDQNTRLKLLRRPVFSNTLELTYDRASRRGGTLFLRYVGARDDIHPVLYTRQRMPAFYTLSLDAYYRLSAGWKLTARGENLLNRHYQETSGFGTAGLSGFLGVEAEL